MQVESRRRDLETFIANSRDVRRKVVWAGASGLVLALALRIAGLGTASLAVALVAAVIAGAGAWITTAHIQDFEKELRGLGGHRPATLRG
jgi:hypothetical protein